MRHLFIAVASLSALACATPPKPRVASEYLLVTDKSSAAVLKDVQKKLEEIKYSIRTVDPEVGVLVTKPRRFSYTKGGVPASARQSLQVRQEGGSVKLRFQYECELAAQGGAFAECFQEDQALDEKIRRIEPSVVRRVREVLLKHKSEEKPFHDSD